MKMLEKLQKRLQEGKKNNNKGFSLVELIIVIAIMAILVGIVGTQVIPYIENSRKAKDIQIFSGLVTDAMSAYSSQAANLDPSAVYTITVDVTTGTGAVTPDTAKGADNLESAFNVLRNGGDLGLSSKAASAVTSITIKCQNTYPMITLEAPADEFDDITAN